MKIRFSVHPGFIATILTACLIAAFASARAGDCGKISLDTRLRLESADIDGFEDADNLSLRLRLGYTTPIYGGFLATVEGEFTGVADEGAYNAAGVHGDINKAVIADPKNAALDQLFGCYTYKGTAVKIGRQVIALDNQRFVGNVNWRQNRQTYDAVTFRNADVKNLTLFYGYVDNVVRIYGSEAPDHGVNAGETDSSSHLINASYKVADSLVITTYAYLLNLKDLPAELSSDSYGASAKGRVPLAADLAVGYYAEYAVQQDAGNNPLDYDAAYYHLAADGSYKGWTTTIGYEVLGSDRTGSIDTNGASVHASFSTPLATLHKFNGFADRFLITPSKGLEDFYITLGWKIPLPQPVGPIVAEVWRHDFAASEGSMDLGTEWDGVLSKPLQIKGLPGEFNVIAKYASYEKGDAGTDTERLSFELNYNVVF